MDVMQYPPGNQRVFSVQCGDKGTCYGERQDCNGNYHLTSLAPGTDVNKVAKAVQQMRIAVGDCQLPDYTDQYLIKWLSVQDFDPVRAEKMLRQCLEWRRLNRVDEILDVYTPSEVFKKYYSDGQVGFDKCGCPVFISAIGRVDPKGIFLSSVKKEHSDFFIWLEETYARRGREATDGTGKQVGMSTIILDFEHFSMKQLTCKTVVQQMFEVVKIKTGYYPMENRRIFAINAPKLSFQLMFTMVKPFVPECVLGTIKVFGSNKAEWTAALLEEIDADQLPAFYGGSMTDPDGDPKCPRKFNMGGEVPQTYYLKNSAPVPKDNMQTVNIIAGAGGRKKLKLNVTIARSVLRWEFMTEGGDIRYRVYIKKSKGNVVDVIPLDRVDSHLMMEEGQFTCDEPGKYVFEFDNTFSYLRTKKLHYHIYFDPPYL
ncbi:SEC14-like protein 2 [Daphnia pulex]|uniref:SEC14-like protein 2 n=1 Tax=Daphnia pulex TaxID=6669 RepID=UPI001EDF654F|nr:SEC14-like protein 2 [Daphnia pulex]